jgi:hypothetical protein
MEEEIGSDWTTHKHLPRNYPELMTLLNWGV